MNTTHTNTRNNSSYSIDSVDTSGGTPRARLTVNGRPLTDTADNLEAQGYSAVKQAVAAALTESSPSQTSEPAESGISGVLQAQVDAFKAQEQAISALREEVSSQTEELKHMLSDLGDAVTKLADGRSDGPPPKPEEPAQAAPPPTKEPGNDEPE